MAVEPDRRRRTERLARRSCRARTGRCATTNTRCSNTTSRCSSGSSVQLYEMTLISDDAPIDRYFEGDRTRSPSRSFAAWTCSRGDTACSGCHSGAEFTDNSRRILFGAVVDGVQAARRTRRAHVQRRMRSRSPTIRASTTSASGPPKKISATAATIRSAIRCRSSSCSRCRRDQIPSQELLTFPDSEHRQSADSRSASGRVTDGTFKVPEPAQSGAHRAVLPQRRAAHDPPGRRVLQSRRRLPRTQRPEHRLRDRQAEPDRPADRRSRGVSRPSADRSARRAPKRAPFDHPQLFVPNGHVMQRGHPRVTDEGVAQDVFLEIPAVGRGGGPLPAGFLQ